MRDLYISKISLSILLLSDMGTDPGNILIAHRHKNVEIWAEAAIPRKGIHKCDFSLQCHVSLYKGTSLYMTSATIVTCEM